MRQRVGAQSLGLRRQLQDDGAEDVVQATGSASAQANAAHAQSAVTPPATPPRTPPRRPSPAHVGPAEHHAAPAARRTASQPKSSIFLGPNALPTTPAQTLAKPRAGPQTVACGVVG